MTLTSGGGSAVFGQLSRVDDFAPPKALQATGSIDADGHLGFPQAQISWPVVHGGSETLTTPTVTSADITLTPAADAAGSLDPKAGSASLSMQLQPTDYAWAGTLSNDPYTGHCTIGATAPPVALTLTAATPYNQADGTLTLAGTFTLPGVVAPSRDTCAIGGDALITTTNPATFIGAFNSQVAGPGEFEIAGSFNPVIKAPADAPAPADPGPSDPGPTTAATPPASGAPPTPVVTVKCVVPKLIKLDLAHARTALTKAHCRTGKVTRRKARSGQKKGRVVSQGARRGTVKPAGSKIALVLAK